jgi:hypothetical protein
MNENSSQIKINDWKIMAVMFLKSSEKKTFIGMKVKEYEALRLREKDKTKTAKNFHLPSHSLHSQEKKDFSFKKKEVNEFAVFQCQRR